MTDYFTRCVARFGSTKLTTPGTVGNGSGFKVWGLGFTEIVQGLGPNKFRPKVLTETF